MNQKLSESYDASRVNSGLHRIGLMTAAAYLLTQLFYLKGREAHSRTAHELFAWFIVLSLLTLFWKGYQLVEHSRDQFQLQTVLVFSTVFSLLAFSVVPFHSTDAFGYINLGWQQIHYGQDPYLYSLADIPNWQQDPMLRKHWLYTPDTYGFLFTLLTRFLCKIGNGNWWLTLFLFKGINLLAYWVAAWLVWVGARRLGQVNPISTLYLFMWNPLILMHHVANGHNDLLLGCLIVLAMYLAIVGKGFWITPALVAAALMKHVPAAVIPLAFIFVIKRQGWRVALLSCLIGAVIVALAGAPYLPDWKLFRLADIATNSTLIDNSFHSFLIHIFENVARLIPSLSPYHDAVNTLIKDTLRIGFLAFLLIQLVRIPKNFSSRAFLEQSLLSMVVLICVVSSKFNAWYMGMLLPMALLLDPKHWLRRLVILITAIELLSLTFLKQAYILNYFAWVLVPSLIVFVRMRRERKVGIELANEELPMRQDT